jgi:DNA-binding protein YbaB
MLNGMGNMGNMQGMMKKYKVAGSNAGNVIRKNLKHAQWRRCRRGALTIVAMAKKKSKALNSNRKFDRTMWKCQDMIVSGVNEAMRKIDEMIEREMRK